MAINDIAGSTVTLGLAGLYIAPLLADGSPGTDFTRIGYTALDSFAFNEADPSEFRINVEEKQAPLKIKKTKGDLGITFNVADPDGVGFKKARGGDITTSGADRTYSEGDTFSDLEYTVLIVPEEGVKQIQINRASLYGKLANGLGKNNGLMLTITAVALAPLKQGVPVWQFVENVAATVAPSVYTGSMAFTADKTIIDSFVTATVPAVDPDLKFEFVKKSSAIGMPKQMTLKLAGATVANVNFPSDYMGEYFKFTDKDGAAHIGNFNSGDVTLT